MSLVKTVKRRSNTIKFKKRIKFNSNTVRTLNTLKTISLVKPIRIGNKPMNSLYHLYFYYNVGRLRAGNIPLDIEEFLSMFDSTNSEILPSRKMLKATLLLSKFVEKRQADHILTRILEQHFCRKIPNLSDMRGWYARLFIASDMGTECPIHPKKDCLPVFGTMDDAIISLENTIREIKDYCTTQGTIQENTIKANYRGEKLVSIIEIPIKA